MSLMNHTVLYLRVHVSDESHCLIEEKIREQIWVNDMKEEMDNMSLVKLSIFKYLWLFMLVV